MQLIWRYAAFRPAQHPFQREQDVVVDDLLAGSWCAIEVETVEELQDDSDGEKQRSVDWSGVAEQMSETVDNHDGLHEISTGCCAKRVEQQSQKLVVGHER